MDFPGSKIDYENNEHSYSEGEEYEETNYYHHNNTTNQQGGSERNVCDTCEKNFRTYWEYQKHMSEHKTCDVDGCTFTAHEKIIEKHIRMQHTTGLYDKIRNLITPEDIEKWITERKKKYPSKENVEKRYKQQEEMLQRGEKLKRNGQRFDKNNRTRYALNRQKHPSQQSHNKQNKQVPSKRRLPRQRQGQPQSKSISLIDDKADWNGTLFPFRGTSQLYDEVPAENTNDFDDAEWTEDNKSNAPEKIVLNNALGALMCAYNDSDDSEMEDLIPKNESVAKSGPAATATGSINQRAIRTEKVDVLSNEEVASQRKIEQVVVCCTSSDDDAPTEEKIERVEIPIVTDRLNDGETPIEQKIPDGVVSVDKKPDGERNTNKRKRNRNRRPDKRRKHGSNSNTNEEYSNDKSNSQKFPRSMYKKRRITLLERLLQNEIVHERNVLLQCVRYVVANGFFEKKVSDAEKEKVNVQKISDEENKNTNIVRIDSLSENNVM